MTRENKITLKQNIAAVVEVHQINRFNGTPAEAVAALVESIGYPAAVEAVAAIVNAVGTWDRRISERSRFWAADKAPSSAELSDAYIFAPSGLHPAHIEQIATAMSEYVAPAEETAAHGVYDYNEKINAIIEYFENNEETFNDCIEELDGYNGYLCDDRYYSTDDLNDLFCNEKPTDILNRAFFGYDEDTWTRNERGEKTYGPFNPNRDFFRFNGYGNLVSAYYKDYSARLDKYAVEAMQENREYIDTIESDDDLAALFDALENDDENEG